MSGTKMINSITKIAATPTITASIETEAWGASPDDAGLDEEGDFDDRELDGDALGEAKLDSVANSGAVIGGTAPSEGDPDCNAVRDAGLGEKSFSPSV